MSGATTPVAFGLAAATPETLRPCGCDCAPDAAMNDIVAAAASTAAAPPDRRMADDCIGPLPRDIWSAPAFRLRVTLGWTAVGDRATDRQPGLVVHHRFGNLSPAGRPGCASGRHPHRHD